MAETAIARALVGSPAKIYIVDEPTASLDPETEVDVFRLFREMTAGATQIIVSHRLGFAREADRIAVLVDGQLAEVGSHEQLLKRRGTYEQLYRTQSAWYV